ncbi:hypothetical protein VMT65_09190 [Nocardia sp. CDC153]|uniref:endonuclease domain-containing protein n=1 Tax=Nocardia sp. CDC153 TaxID=3112167 RepID=UPI002DB9D845|nr:hypothetical protein [Nocardia sp. CDC153]MEC3953200.1 hypothetical protein [Nocardia sp. CDC153]
MGPDTFVDDTVRLDARGWARAAAVWGGEGAVLVGCSAAAMHGALWFDELPAEVVLPRRARTPENVLVYRDDIPTEDLCLVDGLLCTTPVRTAFDIGRRGNEWQAVERLDSLCRATGLTPAEIEEFTLRHPGARNRRRLIRLLPYVDGGAESLPESRTRLLLHRSGLPKPETQITVFRHGTIIARIDMGWRNWLVGVEYDGAHHWTDPRQRTQDLARYNDLPALGWTIIRANATLLARHPQELITKITAALHQHGYPSPSGTSWRGFV